MKQNKYRNWKKILLDRAISLEKIVPTGSFYGVESMEQEISDRSRILEAISNLIDVIVKLDIEKAKRLITKILMVNLKK